MSERTARKYERAGKLPSQMKQPRTWRTRTNAFEEDWPWVIQQLERDPALQATTLFALLCAQHPGATSQCKCVRCNGIFLLGKPCMDQSKSDLRASSYPGERAQSISPIWRIWR